MSGSSAEHDPVDDAAERRLTRRGFVIAGGATLGIAAVGGAAVATGLVEVPNRVSRIWEGSGPTDTIPSSPVGEVSLTNRFSEARGRDVGFFTAVPAGFGDGTGLPICLVLHGASATTADYERFGLPEFLTAAVEAGVQPFVLVGADGGRSRWQGGGTDDPQTMLRDEIPVWCAELGFDTARVAAHGWSMGGYGSLLLAANNPGWLRSVAVLSPAVGGGQLARRIDDLDGDRVAMWCGTEDSVFDEVKRLAGEIDGGPAITGFGPGRHTRGYWNTVTPAAFEFIGRSLTV